MRRTVKLCFHIAGPLPGPLLGKAAAGCHTAVTQLLHRTADLELAAAAVAAAGSQPPGSCNLHPCHTGPWRGAFLECADLVIDHGRPAVANTVFCPQARRHETNQSNRGGLVCVASRPLLLA